MAESASEPMAVKFHGFKWNLDWLRTDRLSQKAVFWKLLK